MKKKILLFLMLFLILSYSSYSENSASRQIFEGFWCIDADERKIDDYLFIANIDNKFLVVRMSINDNYVQKGIGEIIDENTMQYELNGKLFTLDWFIDEEGEWLEEYIGHRMEEYPIYERIENFPIDKF